MQSTEHIGDVLNRAINHAAARPFARRLECSTADYHADKLGGDEPPTLNQSTATVLVTQSPAHAWMRHPRLGGARPETSDALTTGSLVHALLLDGGAGVTIVDADDWRTKAAREARDAAVADGSTPILASKYEAGVKTANAIRQRLHARGVEMTGTPGVKLLWTQGVEGLPSVLCRGMLDLLDERTGTIWELKTIDSAHPEKCAKHVIEYGYDIQHAAYVSAANTGWPHMAGRWRFVWVFVETSEPYAVTIATPDGATRELGRMRWDRACSIWSRCMQSGEWPDYSTAPVSLSVPQWAINREVERS